MKEKQNNKGFTLAELLIVVAVIAVLVAISIPIFNKQIEKSREAHDIYTMRAIADFAVDAYYSGKVNKDHAEELGLKWWGTGTADQHNAAGVYVPSTGGFVPSRDGVKPYGKGTKVDGGTSVSVGSNTNGMYNTTLDYTNAVCMLSIYPEGNNPHIDIYWKYNAGTNTGKYVGGEGGMSSIPKYSIRISLK